MTEFDVILKLRECAKKAFDEYEAKEIASIDEDEDCKAFFKEGILHIVLSNHVVCKTYFSANDVLMIKYKAEVEDISEPYIVIYFKNNSQLYYYDNIWYGGDRWMYIPHGESSVYEKDLVDIFKKTIN